jgi:hypothetical protein
VVEERPFLFQAGMMAALAVDEHGRRALLAGALSVALVDVASAREIARTAAPGVVAADLGDGFARLYQVTGPGQLAVSDWSLGDGSRVERARVTGAPPILLLARRGDLSVVVTGPREKALVDAASGAVRRFESKATDLPGAALVLASQHVALSLAGEVKVVSRAGEAVASLAVPDPALVYALREPAPGELAVGLWTPSLAGRRTLFVDAATGRVLREEKQLLPAGPRYSGWMPQPEAGSFASRLLADSAGSVFRVDPDGRRREIVASPE